MNASAWISLDAYRLFFRHSCAPSRRFPAPLAAGRGRWFARGGSCRGDAGEESVATRGAPQMPPSNTVRVPRHPKSSKRPLLRSERMDFGLICRGLGISYIDFPLLCLFHCITSLWISLCNRCILQFSHLNFIILGNCFAIPQIFVLLIDWFV
jgi:hypothetical protein